MRKFIFLGYNGFEAVTPNEAYETWGRKGFHNEPLFKVEGTNIYELKGPEYKLLRECDSEEEAEVTLGRWTSDDDDNVVFFETPADAEKHVRDSYEGEPEFEEQMAQLQTAIKALEAE